MNKLLFTRLRGKTAAVLVSEKRVLQIEMEPETAEEEIGAIYVGKVKNIVRNLNAAFVEYRPGINGYYSLNENHRHFYTDGREHNDLKAGDEILVQVTRAAVKTKDAVLSSNLSFTGRYVVLTNTPGPLGISSKIHDKKWKDDWRAAWEQEGPYPFSLVIRTNAYGADPEAVRREARSLWENCERLLETAPLRTCYSVLYRPESFAARSVRDAYAAELEEIVTDLPEVYEELEKMPGSSNIRGHVPLRLYGDDRLPLAALYHLNTVLDQALSRTVWLKSGGYLVIEPTEAMTVIDVNTGKNTAKKSSEETYLRTNLEAAAEIAAQLRLRNLSGIIIVDFIDMKTEENRKGLLGKLRGYMAEDPVKTTLVDMTALGLVEITRKKIRRPLHEALRG